MKIKMKLLLMLTFITAELTDLHAALAFDPPALLIKPIMLKRVSKAGDLRGFSNIIIAPKDLQAVKDLSKVSGLQFLNYFEQFNHAQINYFRQFVPPLLEQSDSKILIANLLSAVDMFIRLRVYNALELAAKSPRNSEKVLSDELKLFNNFSKIFSPCPANSESSMRELVSRLEFSSDSEDSAKLQKCLSIQKHGHQLFNAIKGDKKKLIETAILNQFQNLNMTDSKPVDIISPVLQVAIQMIKDGLDLEGFGVVKALIADPNNIAILPPRRDNIAQPMLSQPANQLPKANTLADLASFGYTDTTDDSILNDELKFKAHKESYVNALKQTSNGAKYLAQSSMSDGTKEQEVLNANKVKFKTIKSHFLNF